MPIERRSDGFLHWDDAPHAPAVGIQSRRLDVCLERVRATGTRGVFGTRPYFSEATLDFLRDLEHIEAVAFWDVRLRSVAGLGDARGLRFLRLTPHRPALDFTAWPQLRTLVWVHHPGDEGHEALSELENLHLWSYRPARTASHVLDLPRTLKRLAIYRASIRRLTELAHVDALTDLRLVRCSNLEGLGGIRDVCPNLERLDVESCSAVTVEDVSEMVRDWRSLTHCSVNGHRLVEAP